MSYDMYANVKDNVLSDEEMERKEQLENFLDEVGKAISILEDLDEYLVEYSTYVKIGDAISNLENVILDLYLKEGVRKQ